MQDKNQNSQKVFNEIPPPMPIPKVTNCIISMREITTRSSTTQWDIAIILETNRPWNNSWPFLKIGSDGTERIIPPVSEFVAMHLDDAINGKYYCAAMFTEPTSSNRFADYAGRNKQVQFYYTHPNYTDPQYYTAPCVIMRDWLGGTPPPMTTDTSDPIGTRPAVTKAIVVVRKEGNYLYDTAHCYVTIVLETQIGGTWNWDWTIKNIKINGIEYPMENNRMKYSHCYAEQFDSSATNFINIPIGNHNNAEITFQKSGHADETEFVNCIVMAEIT